LKAELPQSLRELQQGSIAPVDLDQAAIGPGMAVFTRYAKVVESSGTPMRVRTALALINQVKDEVLSEQEGDFDPETRWAVRWFELHGFDSGPFGDAEQLSKSRNTSMNGMQEHGIAMAQAGKTWLVARADLPEDWDPTTDKRTSVWEVCQHLVKAYEEHGEEAAARLLARTGHYGEVAKELAYRLFDLATKTGRLQEAQAYNNLVTSWPEITRLAATQSTTPDRLFE
jgi:putative DNA methylase